MIILNQNVKIDVDDTSENTSVLLLLFRVERLSP